MREGLSLSLRGPLEQQPQGMDFRAQRKGKAYGRGPSTQGILLREGPAQVSGVQSCHPVIHCPKWNQVSGMAV